MERGTPESGVETCAPAHSEPVAAVYVLRLYITGTTPRSTRAIRNLIKLCRERLTGHYDLEVIDLYQQPALAQHDQIVAIPTLLKKLPLPAHTFIGDLSNEQQLMAGLGLPARPDR